jgi:tRNA uridine 5-carbamoylmethylation protein Kti12
VGVEMNLIFIYGPPAVGKLTVAKELSKITDYKVFHNHLTIDLVSSVFEFQSEIYYKWLHKIRLDLLEAAAESGIEGLIYTAAYSHPEDDLFLEKIKEIIEKHEGQVKFVQLTCKPDTLFSRIKQPSHKEYRKVNPEEKLRQFLEKYNLFSSSSFDPNFKIDNTNLPPDEVAKMFVENYHLPTKF